MPIVTYYLVAGAHSDDAIGDLLTKSCALFAEVLSSPVDRVRAFVQEVRPQVACIGGELVSAGASEAPYFHFMLLEGRPLEQRQRLLRGFTDLLVDCLGIERARVRGGMWLVAPEHWAIGGEPAAGLRADEIAARAMDASGSA